MFYGRDCLKDKRLGSRLKTPHSLQRFSEVIGENYWEMYLGKLKVVTVAL